MGIALSFLPFFDICKEKNAFLDPVLGLGSLEMADRVSDLNAFAKANNYRDFKKSPSVKNLFRDRYCIENFKDCDINDKADLQIDLTQSLPEELIGSFHTVINGGTIEHIFDIATAFKNIHLITKLGGTIIHLSPVTWYNHGFFNINPRLYSLVAKENSYELLAEAFCFMRYNENREIDDSTSLHITFNENEISEEIKRVDSIMQKYSLPANILHFVAYRKIKNNSFKKPYDIQY